MNLGEMKGLVVLFPWESQDVRRTFLTKGLVYVINSFIWERWTSWFQNEVKKVESWVGMRNKTDDTVKSKENYLNDAFSFVFPINFKGQSMCQNFINHVTCVLYKRLWMMYSISLLDSLSLSLLMYTHVHLIDCMNE